VTATAPPLSRPTGIKQPGNSFISECFTADSRKNQRFSLSHKTRAFGIWSQRDCDSTNRNFESIARLDGKFIAHVFGQNNPSGLIDWHQFIFHTIL